MDVKGDPLGIEQKTEISTYWQLLYEIRKIFWSFEMQKNHPILAKRQDLVLINKKK